MDNKNNKYAIAAAIVLVAVILFFLFGRKSSPVNTVINKAADLVFSGAPNAGDVSFNIPGLNYVAGNMPSVSQSKCDSNAPCIFCTIPNASYPSKPTSKIASPEFVTQYISLKPSAGAINWQQIFDNHIYVAAYG